MSEYFKLPETHASWWELLVSRLFGQLMVVEEWPYRVIAYKWNGRLYVHKFITVEDPKPIGHHLSMLCPCDICRTMQKPLSEDKRNPYRRPGQGST